MYEYRATILRVVDGDTVHAEIDLGLDVSTRITLRLAGLDAPEASSPEGIAATAWLAEHAPVGSRLIVRTTKDHREKFGRYLGTLIADGVELNAAMIAAGHASPYGGERRAS